MNSSRHDGLLILDKPLGITSRDAVDRVVSWFPSGIRVGHAGTLDPLATGVLVVCVGQATRLIEFVQEMAKTYLSEIVLGARSDTDDAEGPITQTNLTRMPTLPDVLSAVQQFRGEILQVPPAYSAARVRGRRAYQLARAGREVELASRRVKIHEIEVLSFAAPKLTLKVECGKGTYIRSLARDIGERLGCGGYLSSLRRTRTGPWTPVEAVLFDNDCRSESPSLRPMAEAVANLESIALEPEQVALIRHGMMVSVPALRSLTSAEPGHSVAILDAFGKLVAIASWEPSKQLLRPIKVISE